MRTTQDYDVRRRDYDAGAMAYEADRKGAGWVVFAAILLGLSGLWNFFDGIAAISGAHVYVTNANYVFSDLNTWGWIVLCLGVLQGFAALTLLAGSEFARWIGIVSAGLNAIGQLRARRVRRGTAPRLMPKGLGRRRGRTNALPRRV